VNKTRKVRSGNGNGNINEKEKETNATAVSACYCTLSKASNDTQSLLPYQVQFSVTERALKFGSQSSGLRSTSSRKAPTFWAAHHWQHPLACLYQVRVWPHLFQRLFLVGTPFAVSAFYVHTTIAAFALPNPPIAT
jgi:hypothetical protein